MKHLLHDRVDDYVKEVLVPYFSPLIFFVRDSEQILADGNSKQIESKTKEVFLSKCFATFSRCSEIIGDQ